MTLLAVGLSHRTAPVPLLEKAAVPADQVGKVLDELLSADLARAGRDRRARGPDRRR